MTFAGCVIMPEATLEHGMIQEVACIVILRRWRRSAQP